MHSARRILFAGLCVISVTLVARAAEYRFDDSVPEVTDRVARISFIRGDVQIKHADSDQWEKAVLNLPVIEGDELTTGPDSRFEIQFNTSAHLRVAANSYLKISSLKDDGIAASLPEGSLSVTLTKFDSDKEFFEIDGPRTTVSIQKPGRYRIDSGKAGDQDIRVSVADKGEARVYSSNSGFTLRNDRSALIHIDGALAGEWETGDTARYVDEFDQWSTDRDVVIAKRIDSAYYGKYYDQDIYGADELTDYGSWVHTRDYGYIWRPFRNSTINYVDWSPYRYGHWRWLPAYGWTWVNDEPWGWATYHHGRWIWYNGGWYWSPYSYYRQHRSWWYPALVVLRVINQSVCWYPLPYQYAYYDFNWRHHWDRRDRQHQPGGPVAGPVPRPTPPLQNSEPIPREPQRPIIPVGSAPPDVGVISVPIDDFGRGTRGYKKVPVSDARGIVAKVPTEPSELQRLPVMGDINAKIGSDIRVDKPRELPADMSTRIGAAKRDPGEPLDKGLRDKIVYGNRPAVMPRTTSDDVKAPSDRKTIPPTGAVERPVTKPGNVTVREPQRDDTVVKGIPRTTPSVDDTPRKIQLPKNDPPPAKEPRSEPRQKDPPVTKEPARVEPPKRSDSPPQKEQPRNDPPKKSDPPPQKSEPSKPADSPKTTRSKDGT